MKTLQDFFTELTASDELKNAFTQAVEENKVADFLKQNDCNATEAELKAFLTEKAEGTKSLSSEELDNVAGGSLARHILEATRGAFAGLSEALR